MESSSSTSKTAKQPLKEDNDKSVKKSAANDQTKKGRRRPPVATNRLLKVIYGLPAWNQSSTEIDYATIFMKDTKSNKLVQIRLEETEPDSSTFQGQFAINWGNVEDIVPYIYVADKEITNSKDMVSFINKINANQVKRKPFILRRGERGEQVVDVYDTRDQALSAMKAYRETQRLKKLAQAPKPIIDDKIAPKEAVLEAEKLAQIKAAQEALAIQAAEREAERVRLEQLEKHRAEERKKAQENRLKAENESRKRQAAELAEKAMQAYKSGDFKLAEETFAEAVELDPENTSYYFRYGVSLYKTEKFNRSLVILAAAKVEADETLERDFYIGLNHYRLNEMEKAIEKFSQIKATKVKPTAPSAAFYEGMVYFQQTKYTEAQTAFQFVLDNSDSPSLDERAEEYIEKIARIKNFEANKAKKILLEGSIGAMYDSNVLQQADSTSDQGAATNMASPRMMLAGSIEYRPVYEANHEASIKTSVSNIYTTDTALSTADPLVLGVTVPYRYKGTAWTRGYQMTLEPLYEHLQMPVGTPLLDSAGINFDNTFVMNNLWFSTYKFSIRKDNALTTPSSTDDDSNAMKISLSSEQTYFKDKERRTATMSKVGLVLNTAEGKNNSYQRIDLGIGYLKPWKWETSVVSKLDLFYLSYNARDTVRNDTNYALSLSLGKKINDWSSWGAVMAYSMNNSSDTSGTYNKLVLTGIYSTKIGF
jgi:tetratricopeptide (TPR) repeat protein